MKHEPTQKDSNEIGVGTRPWLVIDQVEIFIYFNSKRKELVEPDTMLERKTAYFLLKYISNGKYIGMSFVAKTMTLEAKEAKVNTANGINPAVFQRQIG